MAGPLTKEGLRQLADGNLKWLRDQSRTLEREHLIDVMQHWVTDVAEARQLVAENRTLVQDKIELRRLLRRVVAHYLPQTRWPCHECDRPGPNAPLRINEVHTESSNHYRLGCSLCNGDALLADIASTLGSP